VHLKVVCENLDSSRLEIMLLVAMKRYALRPLGITVSLSPNRPARYTMIMITGTSKYITRKKNDVKTRIAGIVIRISFIGG
jgi:hypothetical protein